jgi:hypothetical protein
MFVHIGGTFYIFILIFNSIIESAVVKAGLMIKTFRQITPIVFNNFDRHF